MTQNIMEFSLIMMMVSLLGVTVATFCGSPRFALYFSEGCLFFALTLLVSMAFCVWKGKI